MPLFDPVLRLVGYYQRNGLFATCRRAGELSWRAVFLNTRILVCSDLRGMEAAQSKWALPDSMAIERVSEFGQIRGQDWQKIASTRTVAVCRRAFFARLKRGATMWLLRKDRDLVAYGWTIPCMSLERRYYPAGDNDVHFFEFLVFPEHRGLQILSLMINHIVHTLAAEGKTRAFHEIAQWNEASMNSRPRTTFQPIGISKKRLFRRRELVRWIGAEESSAPPVGFPAGAVTKEG
ncbi:MAG TPA: GNAT family N-acetyltransferase [Terriglobales bacterium]